MNNELRRKLPLKRLEKRRRIPSPYRKPKETDFDMTICIAAIHNDGGIIGVADKMISTVTMAFEPKGITKKMFCLAEGIFAFNAGHIALQAEIMEALQAGYNNEKSKGRTDKYTVREMVNLYVDCYNKIKRFRIKNAVYAPWKLDEDSFLARQKEFSDVFVRDLMDQVARFQMEEIATIFAGVDASTGNVEPHIYTVKCGGYGEISIECFDSVGYAAIGSGAFHVESYFMFSKFTRHFSMPKVMALCYFAKRRSELAPNVGKETDMVLIGPTLGFNKNLENVLDYKMLSKMYDDINDNEKTVTDAAFNKIYDELNGKIPIKPSPYD